MTATKTSKGGRPRKLDFVKRREIVALITAGWSKARAAAYVGCSLQTVLNEGQRNPRFRHDMLQAARNRKRADAGENVAFGATQDARTPDTPTASPRLDPYKVQKSVEPILKEWLNAREAGFTIDFRELFRANRDRRQ